MYCTMIEFIFQLITNSVMCFFYNFFKIPFWDIRLSGLVVVPIMLYNSSSYRILFPLIIVCGQQMRFDCRKKSRLISFVVNVLNSFPKAHLRVGIEMSVMWLRCKKGCRMYSQHKFTEIVRMMSNDQKQIGVMRVDQTRLVIWDVDLRKTEKLQLHH